MKKNVVIDFSRINDYTGFGEVARRYYAELCRVDAPDLHFIAIVPPDYTGVRSENIDYLTTGNELQDLQRLGLSADLWHTTDQRQHLSPRKSGAKRLLTIHDINFIGEKTGIHRLKRILKMKLKIMRSDYISVISQYVKDDISTHIGFGNKGVSIVYNGVPDIESAPREQPAFVKDPSAKFFFTIGQVIPKKNFKTLLPLMDAFPDHHLYICGETPGSYADDIREQIATRYADRVFLTGQIEHSEKYWLYAHCAAFLFPSKLEGFGLPIVEAMRFRCNIVASQLTSIPEIAQDYISYWADFTPEHMISVLQKALDIPQETLQRRHEEMYHYSQRFNYANYTAQYLELYRSI